MPEPQTTPSVPVEVKSGIFFYITTFFGLIMSNKIYMMIFFGVLALGYITYNYYFKIKPLCNKIDKSNELAKELAKSKEVIKKPPVITKKEELEDSSSESSTTESVKMFDKKKKNKNVVTKKVLRENFENRPVLKKAEKVIDNEEPNQDLSIPSRENEEPYQSTSNKLNQKTGTFDDEPDNILKYELSKEELAELESRL